MNEEIKQAWIPHPPETPKVSKESSIAEDAAECIYELEIKSKFGASRGNFTVSFYGDDINKVLNKSFEITETMQRMFTMSYTDHVAFYGVDVGSLNKISIHHYSNGDWEIDEIMIRKLNEVFRFHCRTSFPPTYSADTLNRTYLIVNMQKKTVVDSNENSMRQSEQDSVSVHSEIKRPKTAFGNRYQESETENSLKSSKIVLPPLEVKPVIASNENGSSIKSLTILSSKASDLKLSTKEPKNPLKSVKLEKLDLKSNFLGQNTESSEKNNDNVLLSAKDSNKSSPNLKKDPLSITSVEEKTKTSLKNEVIAEVSENSKSLKNQSDVEENEDKSNSNSSNEDSSLSISESEKTLLSTKLEKEPSKSISESSSIDKTFSNRSKELTFSESSKATKKRNNLSSKRSSTSSESTSQSEISSSTSLENSLISKTTQSTVTRLSENKLESEKNLAAENENSYKSSDEESTTIRNDESLKVSSKDEFFDEEIISTKSPKPEEKSKTENVDTKSKDLAQSIEENEKTKSKEENLNLKKRKSSESLLDEVDTKSKDLPIEESEKTESKEKVSEEKPIDVKKNELSESLLDNVETKSKDLPIEKSEKTKSKEKVSEEKTLDMKTNKSSESLLRKVDTESKKLSESSEESEKSKNEEKVLEEKTLDLNKLLKSEKLIKKEDEKSIANKSLESNKNLACDERENIFKKASRSESQESTEIKENLKVLNNDEKQKHEIVVEKHEETPKIRKTLSSDTLHETASLLSSYEADRDEDCPDKNEEVNRNAKLEDSSTKETIKEENLSLRSSLENGQKKDNTEMSPNNNSKELDESRSTENVETENKTILSKDRESDENFEPSNTKAEGGDSKLKEIIKSESNVENKVIFQNKGKQTDEFENLGSSKHSETSEKSENLTLKNDESKTSQASKVSGASSRDDHSQTQNENSNTETNTCQKQTSTSTNKSSHAFAEENVTDSKTINENKIKAEKVNEVKTSGEVKNDLTKEFIQNDVVVEQKETKSSSIASSDDSLNKSSTSYTSSISTTTDSSLRSNKTNTSSHGPKKSETEPKFADKFNKKTNISKEIVSTSKVRSSRKDSEIQKFAKSLVDSIINSKESLTSSNGESLSSSLTKVSTVENSNIRESKKTDIFDTEQGENTVTYKKVPSFWTHMSENQKDAINKSLEKIFFYQSNPSAKEADERRREIRFKRQQMLNELSTRLSSAELNVPSEIEEKSKVSINKNIETKELTKNDSVSRQNSFESKQIRKESEIGKTIELSEKNEVSKSSVFENSEDIYELINSSNLEKLKLHLNLNPEAIRSLNAQGMNPLQVATCLGNQQIINVLISSGADLNARTARGFSSLHMAASYNHHKTLETLLENGSSVNCTNKDLQTPLHLACRRGHFVSVVVLLKHGADPDLCDSRNRNAMDYAVSFNHEDIIHYLNKNKKT